MRQLENRYWIAAPRVSRLCAAAGERRDDAAQRGMRIDVTSAGFVLTAALRGDVRRRVLLAMSRFSPELHGVSARLRESHNPLGGVDQRCRLRATLRSGRVLRSEASNGLIETALGRSVERLALLVAESLDHGAANARAAPRLRRQ
jgi:hypothetical protein